MKIDFSQLEVNWLQVKGIKLRLWHHGTRHSNTTYESVKSYKKTFFFYILQIFMNIILYWG